MCLYQFALLLLPLRILLLLFLDQTLLINDNIDQKIICFTDRYIINPEINEGNCIDDFIRRGVEPLVENINDLKESIKSRVKEREISISYHTTGCFERDFTEISLIKKQAEKIIENCNKHLERISEFYTR